MSLIGWEKHGVTHQQQYGYHNKVICKMLHAIMEQQENEVKYFFCNGMHGM
jgi:hypothetical protein